MGLLMAASLVLFSQTAWSKAPQKSEFDRLIKDSENLSLIQDRAQACAVLIRAVKSGKFDNETAAKLLEKNKKLARLFYTDQGFQSFLTGQSFFDQGKYKEALEHFRESIDSEKNNLSLLLGQIDSYLKLKNTSAAGQVSLEAEALSPFDPDVVSAKVQVLEARENWEPLFAVHLSKIPQPKRAETFKSFGVAALKLGKMVEAEKLFLDALALDRDYPEPHYWLGVMKEKEMGKSEFSQYKTRCAQLKLEDQASAKAAQKKYSKENDLCGFLEEVKKALLIP